MESKRQESYRLTRVGVWARFVSGVCTCSQGSVISSQPHLPASVAQTSLKWPNSQISASGVNVDGRERARSWCPLSAVLLKIVEG